VTVNFEQFEKLRPQMLGLARALLRNLRVRLDAEDLVQTVLTEIYSKLKQGTEIKSPHSYANVAIKNRVRDEIRRFHNKYEDSWPEPLEDGPGWEPPDPAQVPQDQQPLLEAVMNHLEPGERCFLWRIVFEQRGVKEAQELCGWPEKSPYFHYRKLLDKVRTFLGARDDTPQDPNQ